MYLESKFEFASAQAASGFDAISENVVDLQSGNTVLGNRSAAATAPVGKISSVGHPWHIVFTVDTTFDTAGEAGTLDINLETDSNVGLTASPTVHAKTRQFAEAELVAGFQFSLAVPEIDGQTVERYMGLRFTENAGDAFTAGAISAVLVAGAVQSNS